MPRAIIATLLALATLLTGPIPSVAKDKKAKPVQVEVLKQQIPMGIEGFFVRPARHTLYVIGTARSPLFGGWKIVGTGPHRAVLGPDGSRVRYFPQRLQFRVTVNATDNPTMLVDRDTLDVNDDMNHFLLNLRFRVKVFHGLDATALDPDEVELVGMPADVRYSERVYRMNFTLPPVPIEDRLVLEVLTPDEQRLCRFHLEF